jgi:phage shock protein PspC (stress-responsive transcriptional regulator)
MVGGVCGGLARYWNTDPTLLRILTVVLTLATGGAFLVGYIIAWIAIPDDPMGPYPPFGQGPRADQVGFAAGGNPPYADQATQYTAAPRERSYLGWLVVSGAVLVAGILGLIGYLASPSVQFWGILFGVILAILGVGLLVGAWYGRARWLVFLAVPMAFLTFGTVAAGNWVQDNPNWERWSEGSGSLSVGDRNWVVTPTAAADSPLEYNLSAGDAVLDLTALTAGPTTDLADTVEVSIDAGVGLGQLVVLIPADMRLELDAEVNVGQISVPGRDRVEGTNLSLDTTIEPLRDSVPSHIVTLDAAIGAGNLEVRRAQA